MTAYQALLQALPTYLRPPWPRRKAEAQASSVTLFTISLGLAKMLQGQTFLPVPPSSFQQIVMGTLPCVSRSSAEDSEANKHQSPGAVCSPVIKADLPNKWFQDQVVRAQRERYRVQRT